MLRKIHAFEKMIWCNFFINGQYVHLASANCMSRIGSMCSVGGHCELVPKIWWMLMLNLRSILDSFVIYSPYF